MSKVPAKMTTDDDRYVVLFDAAPWFAQATPAEIKKLVEDEYEDGETTDAIVTWTVEEAGNKRLERAMAHCFEAEVGYETKIDAKAAREFVAKLRRGQIKLVKPPTGKELH